MGLTTPFGLDTANVTRWLVDTTAERPSRTWTVADANFENSRDVPGGHLERATGETGKETNSFLPSGDGRAAEQQGPCVWESAGCGFLP